MQTPVEQLQAIAKEWAAKLGGKIKVGLQILVTAGPDSRKPYFCAEIGGAVDGWHHCTEKGTEQAMTETERQWRMDGSPTDPREVERCKLKARAAELGMRIVEDTP